MNRNSSHLTGIALVLIAGVIGFGNFLYAQIATTDTTSTTTTTPTPTTTTTTALNPNTTTFPNTAYIDTTPPIIKLVGLEVIYLKVGATYVEYGALAYDNLDGDISARVVHESNINTSLPGVYNVVYLVRDRAGNMAKVARTVYVVAPPPITTQIEPTTIAPTEPVKTILPTNTIATTSIAFPSKDSLQTQTDRLLEILRQGNVQRIEEEKRRIIRNATSSSKIPPTIHATSTENGGINQPSQESPEVVQEKIQKVLERAQNISDEIRTDSDSDGVSDYDEKNIYGTDVQSADTDGDGYSDRAEITTGFDPKNPDLHATITYENPKDSGEVKKDILTVAAISVAETKIEAEKKVASKIEFKGKGLPNSFVTIYIFSTPTVVTVKTDSEGNWEYTLDKELPDGNHEMYVAMTDNAGKILAKSTAIPFVKEANAITVDQNFLTPISGGKSPGLLWGEYMYATVTVILSIIGIVFAIIGMRAQPSYRRYRNPDMNNDAGNDNNHV